MVASSLTNVTKFIATSGGTGSFVVSAAVTGYQTPATAAAVGGATYSYRAESTDLTQWEIGSGTYTSSNTTLTRTPSANSVAGTSAINFTLAPQVGFVALTGDIVGPAAKTDMETATSTVLSPTAATTKNHPGVAKAWAYLTVSAGTYTNQASYNVTSFTKNGTGDVTITFTSNFASANYASVLQALNTASVTIPQTGTQNSSNIRCNFFTSSGTLIDSNFAIVCYGTQ